MEFTFRLLSVNLSNGETSTRLLPASVIRTWLGGSSLGAHILYPWLVEELDPLSPEAPLLFLTGPLTGTIGAAVGRYVLCAKSPATNLWGESHIGGYFGPELRAAGYDGLLITGRASTPVYIWIHNEKVEIRSADHLWRSCDTLQTQEKIKDEIGDRLVRVACIGLAGENMLRFGSVLCDHGRVAGRTGMGAVMGSKQLKAIAVRGKKPVPVAQPEKFSLTRRQVNINLKDDNFSRTLREIGTAGIADYLNYLGCMPSHYFTRGFFEGTERISGTTVAETILSGVSTCHGCVIACGRVVRLDDGVERVGPEYETTVGFGSNLGIDDVSAITKLNELCDRYGVDTISLSNVIGLAFLLYQEGVITPSSSSGEQLIWGDSEVVERLVHSTVKREGFGDLLARGSKALAEHFNLGDMAAQVNDLEIPFHDPRGSSGMALVYATSPRGACHNQSDYFLADEFGQTYEDIGIDHYDRQAGAEKAANVARHQDWRTMNNSLILCYYANVSPQTVLNLVNQVTDFGYTIEELITVGERAWNLKRVINHRLGLTRENDRLPKHLLKPLPDGGSAGYVPPFDEMLGAYYKARGWDSETGRPSPERLQTLDLDEYVADVWGD